MIVRRPSLAAAILVLALVPLFGPAASMQQAARLFIGRLRGTKRP